jgi:hypothetical protein
MPVHPRHSRGQACADDRLAARHGLELHVPEGFSPRDRREHEDIARVVQRDQFIVGHVAGETDPVGQLELASESRPCRSQRPVADEHGRRVETNHRPQQNADAFVRNHPACEQNQGACARALANRRRARVDSRRRVPSRRIDPERNDPDPIAVPRQRGSMLGQQRG